MTDDPWHTERLDLDAYLTRIGVPVRPPSRAALDELHEAHVRTFTFDNIDVLLDQHPGVSLDAVQDKFVHRGRGGYCFEHATLFAAATQRLGYATERRLGRVGDPAASARTHCVVLVTVDDEPLLADLGFGLTLLRPIALKDQATEDHGGWAYQVRRTAVGIGNGWELRRAHNEGWELMHTHDELPVHPDDLVCGHHFTSTFPTSHFRHTLMVTRHTHPGEHVTVTHGAVTIRRPGQPTEHRPIDTAELAQLLRQLDVPLAGEEEQRLLARAAQLRATDSES